MPKLTTRTLSSLPNASQVPIIDLSADESIVVPAVASAMANWGFFQVLNHGVDAGVRAEFEEQMQAFFDIPMETKRAMKRSADNARGFFDDELTKQRVDWKQALDFGVTPSHDWSLPDADPRNANLDGFNRFPPNEILPRFRPSMVTYIEALTPLAERLSSLMALGLEAPRDFFSKQLREEHTSFLRLNYYPPLADASSSAATAAAAPPLGISPHKDAGFLTILAQDDGCHSLQVQRRSDGEWLTVHPEEGALTINTGDMAQIWSNDRYHAPLHRVLAHETKRRYSAPFFYNPGYNTRVSPIESLGSPKFSDCVWGYFRAQRFAGDFADYGTEIQISDFSVERPTWHVTNQPRFLAETNFSQPFSLEDHRELLQRPAHTE